MFIDLGYGPGARAYRALELSEQSVPGHRHETVAVTVPILGSLKAIYDGGEAWLQGAAFVVHPVGVSHGGAIDATGMDTFEIEFDPGWLAYQGIALPDRTYCKTGGAGGAAALELARTWLHNGDSESRVSAAQRLFASLSPSKPYRVPSWLEDVQLIIRRNAAISVQELARLTGLTPQWLTASYRKHVGEGIQATIRRRRLEAAALMLRHTSEPLAAIAYRVGFCDQSHMNRVFSATLGRSPLEVRLEAQPARPAAADGAAGSCPVGAPKPARL